MSTFTTPGPWFVTKSKHGIDGSHYEVAIVACEREDRALVVHAAEGFDEQGDGNARLIASSPDMLKGLEQTKKWLEKLRPAVNTIASEIIRDIIADHIDPAIAKATGA